MKTRAFLFFALSLSGFFPERAGAAAPGRFFRSLPVQHQGRVKPFDTLSRETLREVSGRETYKKRSAADVILSWALVPDYWNKTAFILAESRELKEALGLPVRQKRFAPEDFFSNKRFSEELAELHSLRSRGEELDGFYTELQNLERRLILYESSKTGRLLQFQPAALAAKSLKKETAPPGSGETKREKSLKNETAQTAGAASVDIAVQTGGGDSDKPKDAQETEKAKRWIPLRDMKGEPAAAFQKALAAYVRLISQQVAATSGASGPGGGSASGSVSGSGPGGENLKPAGDKAKPQQAAAKSDKKEAVPALTNSVAPSFKISAEKTRNEKPMDPKSLRQKEQDLKAAVQKFKQEVFKDKGPLYFSERKMQAEVFTTASILFFGAGFFTLLSFAFGRQ